MRIALLLALLAIGAYATPLDDYVNAPDPTYNFELKNTWQGIGYTGYAIRLTSQSWLTPQDSNCPIWNHWLTICVPNKMNNFNTGILYINGGGNGAGTPSKIDPIVEILCVSSGTVAANLDQIPNQPCVFATDPLQKKRSEDAFIAFTWYHFLKVNSTDPTWLARFPMTKAVVKAFDAVQSFTANMPNVPTVKDFIIAGASKRGWTTWTTAGVDKRVRGFIPIVMPIGNMVETINEMYQVYGGWSFALQDYLDMHIMDDLNMPNFKKMADLIDPIVYNNLGRWANKPYYVIAAAGDEFFLPTSINHSWNQLNGNKYLRIVPDAEHSLVGQQLDVALSADSFINMVLNNEPGPVWSWKLITGNDTGSIIVTIPPNQPGTAKLSGVYVWSSQTLSSTQRDYRLIVCPRLSPECINPVLWFYTEIKDTGNGVYVAKVNKPSWGWKAFLVEAVFTFTWPGDILNPTREFRVTTEVNVVPDTLPFPPCGLNCQPPTTADRN